MTNYLEFDLENKHWDSVPFSDAGNSEVEEDTTNAGKAICTNANGKIDTSLFPWYVDIMGSLSVANGGYEILATGEITVVNVVMDNFFNNRRYDGDGEISRPCVDFRARQLIPLSGYTYEPSLDWSDENCVKTRVIDDLAGLNWGFFRKQDFSAGERVASGQLLGVVSNTNGQVAYLSVDPSTNNGVFAYLYVSTTTNSTGSAQARGETGFKIDTDFCEYEMGFRVQLSTLSSSSEEYTVQIGLSDATSSSDELAGNNHIGFRYDRATYGENWHTVTHKSDNTNTIIDTGVSVSTSWTKFRIHVDRNNSASRIRFYIDGALEATHTTNIPITIPITNLLPRFAIKKSVGTTARTARMEHIWNKMKFLAHQDRV